MVLLEAVELYGFGNWEDTAAFIGKKSVEEVRDHFINYYIDGALGRVSWASVEDTYTVTDESCPKSGPLSPTITSPLRVIPEMSLAEQQHLGYMPKRDDFERELDNEAEALISMLSINADDDEVDTDLKLAHIDMYRRRLTERFRVKAIVREYGLVSLFYKSLLADDEFMSRVTLTPSLLADKTLASGAATAAADEDTNHSSTSSSSKTAKKKPSSPAKATADHRDGSDKAQSDKTRDAQLAEKLKIFSQFESSADHNAIIDNIRREKELKVRIRELLRYRRNGLKRFTEAAIYEAARVKRDKKKENKKKVRVIFNFIVIVVFHFITFPTLLPTFHSFPIMTVNGGQVVVVCE